ncbi:MAG: peptidoglycan-binding protein [Pyrinomonadaceae bacterium]
MNPSSESRLKKIHPELANRVRMLIDKLAQGGIQLEVVQGMRTIAEQDALFAQGRSKPGNVVTNARGGQSNHNYGLAVDLVPFTNGKPNWLAPNSIWMALGSEAESLGLEWGGSWKKFLDRPHVQLPGLSVKTCQSLFKKGGMDAVWAEATRILQNASIIPTAPPPTSTPGTLPTQPSTEPPAERMLKLKDRGEGVRFIQTRLAALGLIGQSDVDGVFGKRTQAAVKKFQAAHNLKADGIVGPQTRVALMS